MKLLIILCEGQTEQEFCNDVLSSHFLQHDILLQAPTIKKTRGGIVAWDVLKRQIIRHLRENGVVTTFIDFYGIKDVHNFPKWSDAKKIVDKNARMDFLEKAMLEDFEDKHRNRVIPYLQLHEFEGLLFNNIEVFENQFKSDEFKDKQGLIDTINNNPNPELINDNPATAPSKRLDDYIVAYGKSKVVYGSILAEDIGLENIRAKCPRFNAWIGKLESI